MNRNLLNQTSLHLVVQTVCNMNVSNNKTAKTAYILSLVGAKGSVYLFVFVPALRTLCNKLRNRQVRFAQTLKHTHNLYVICWFY